MLPSEPVQLDFDPAENPGTCQLWALPAGRLLMLLWRPCHLCGADWYPQALGVARAIEARRPDTIAELFGCFTAVIAEASEFTAPDVSAFCMEAIEYFAGENSVRYAGEISGVATMEGADYGG